MNQERWFFVWCSALTVLLSAVSVVAQELPPDVLADLYLVQAERQIQDGDAAAAAASLDNILALQTEHGLPVPLEFWFKHAEVSLDAMKFDQAISSATQYLSQAGREGEYYILALQLIDDATQARARDIEARRRAEESRQREEAFSSLSQALERLAASGTGTCKTYSRNVNDSWTSILRRQDLSMQLSSACRLSIGREHNMTWFSETQRAIGDRTSRQVVNTIIDRSNLISASICSQAIVGLPRCGTLEPERQADSCDGFAVVELTFGKVLGVGRFSRGDLKNWVVRTFRNGEAVPTEELAEFERSEVSFFLRPDAMFDGARTLEIFSEINRLCAD